MNPEMMRQMMERMAAQRAMSTGRQNMPMMPGMDAGRQNMPMMPGMDAGRRNMLNDPANGDGRNTWPNYDPANGDGRNTWPNYDPARGDATSLIASILASLAMAGEDPERPETQSRQRYMGIGEQGPGMGDVNRANEQARMAQQMARRVAMQRMLSSLGGRFDPSNGEGGRFSR